MSESTAPRPPKTSGPEAAGDASADSSRPATPAAEEAVRVLLVDDEDRFRQSLASRLELRGLSVSHTGDPEQAIRMARQRRPDVVLLDRKMPKLHGEEVLKELKQIAPEMQVIMLTGHASMDSAAESGRLGAFAYLEKPCETDSLLHTIQAARQEKRYALSRADMTPVEHRSALTWLWGTQNFRPGVMMLGALILAVAALMPTPASMTALLSAGKTGDRGSDRVAGYADYSSMKEGESVAAYQARINAKKWGEVSRDEALRLTGFKARVMVATLTVAAMFWATGALPIGITGLLVAVLMIVFGVYDPSKVAKAFAKDSVVFIIGVLALSRAVAKTGLDRRIGLVLLGTSRSIKAYLFIFLPLLGVTASFLSEHALVAFIAPLLMVVYQSAVKGAGIKRDPALAVMLILGLCFAANQGGPGSPAAGGRNAVMVGILADYGGAPSFGQWVMYGLPFVPVMALVIASYFALRFRGKLQVGAVNVAAIVRKESEKLGKMTREEHIAAVVLVGVIAMWVGLSGRLGMGGPALIGLVALAATRIIGWKTINGIPWDVVSLYGAATAMGMGLATSGAALWIAGSFTAVLPKALSSGDGLAIASSLFTGILTNFMSDGATVAALGPVAIPMATLSGSHPWQAGLATAFASSFANCFIVGTPNNALAYALARDPNTGEQLVTLSDFLKHGVAVTALAFGVLWLWVFHGYWQWIGF